MTRVTLALVTRCYADEGKGRLCTGKSPATKATHRTVWSGVGSGLGGKWSKRCGWSGGVVVVFLFFRKRLVFFGKFED